MAATIKLLTAEEFWELPSPRWSELIDVVVVELSPPGGEHGRRQMRVGRVLFRAEDAGVGFVLGEIGFILRRNPDAVRAPDVAFVRKERVPLRVSPRPSGRAPRTLSSRSSRPLIGRARSRRRFASGSKPARARSGLCTPTAVPCR